MKSHIDRLKDKSIVICDVFKDRDGIKKRSSDGECFDIVNDGYKLRKEFYLKDKLVFTQTDYDKKVKYNLLLKKVNKKVECPNCGYQGPLEEFFDGCKYCGTDFNTNLTNNNVGLTYYIKMLSTKKFLLMVVLIAAILSMIFSFLTTEVDDVITKIFYGIVGIVPFWFISYILCLIVCLPYMVKGLTNNQFKVSKEITSGNIDIKKIVKCLFGELNHYLYSTDADLIDYDIYKVRRMTDERIGHDLYINVAITLRKYYLKDNEIIVNTEYVTVRLEKNKYMRLYNTHTVIKCNSCGHSIDISKDECDFCHTKNPRIAYWIIDSVK